MITLNMASKARHKKVRCKIDTKSDGSLLLIQVYLSLFLQATRKSLQWSVDPHVSLYAYNGTEIQKLGRCKLRVFFNSQSALCDFYITDRQIALFGLPDMENLKIITVHADPKYGMQLSTQYQDKAKYDGKIDQCETNIHDKTDDNEPEKYDKKSAKRMTTL